MNETTMLDVWISELNEIREGYRAYGELTAIGELKLKRIAKEIQMPEELKVLKGDKDV